MEKATKLYFAKWVVPVAGPPLEDAGLAIAGETIVAVGERDVLTSRFPGVSARDFGDAVILPGFVNSHSHLELTAMRGYLEAEERDFFAWLTKLTIARRERMTDADLYDSAAWGAVEALRAGITCVADAGDSALTTIEAMADAGLRGIVYQEAFGPNPADARTKFDSLREKFDGLRNRETNLVRAGISPHAPYTVSPKLLELIGQFALDQRLPLMIHAAESEAETRFMLEGRGPFAESLSARGIVWDPPGVSTVEYLDRLGILRCEPLLAHCIRVSEEDIDIIRKRGARIAHCPKSNAKLGHGRAPLKSFMEAGLTVGLGSDSVASNNSCDLLEESRFALLIARAAETQTPYAAVLTAENALRVATAGGARAIGLGNLAGTLAEGAAADIAIIGLDHARQVPAYDPYSALIFASSGSDVLMTIVAGREVFSDGRIQTVDEERLRVRISEIEKKLRVPLARISS